MDVELTRDSGSLLATVSGRINTATAPDLESQLLSALGGTTDLTIDMKDVLYISSAGLRVILTVQKVMSRQGSFKLRNLRPEVFEVFEMTGFSQFITIE